MYEFLKENDLNDEDSEVFDQHLNKENDVNFDKEEFVNVFQHNQEEIGDFEVEVAENVIENDSEITETLACINTVFLPKAVRSLSPAPTLRITNERNN